LGIDGRKPDEVAKALVNLLPEPEKEQHREICSKRQKLTPGSTGCYLAHMSAWKYAYQTRKPNEQYVLILEDDANFAPFGVENMEIIMEKAMKYLWDILYIGHSKHVTGTKYEPLLVRPFDKQPPVGHTNSGFWGYIIRLDAVPELLKSVESFQDASVDATIVRHFGDNIQALFSVPSLVSQSSLMSVRVSIDKRKL
jgi:GR25 family glycosyltransferase involved in LPS biosynthesis